MKDIKFTSGQISALVVIIIIVLILSFRTGLTSDVRQELIAVMMIVAGYLWGSSVGSHAKDKAQTEQASQMIDALKNSTPIQKVLTEKAENPIKE